MLEELTIILHVVNARENLFKIAQSELLLLKIYY